MRIRKNPQSSIHNQQSGYKHAVKRFAISALVLLTACSSPPPSPPPADPKEFIEKIAELEDARRLDDMFMAAAAGSRSPEVLERLAVALGRIMAPESLTHVVALYVHMAPFERAPLVFALGQMGLRPDGLRADELDMCLKLVTGESKSPDEAVRATAVEALGKLAGDQAPIMVLPFLKDSSPRVRRQAASACFRWRQVLRWRDPAAKAPDLAPDVDQALSEATADSDAEVRWRAAHALLRSASKPSPETVKTFLADSEPLCRVFALNIVERLKLRTLADEVAHAQSDKDAQVRHAALRALDALDRPELLSPRLARDPSYHVRSAVAALLPDEGALLAKLAQDASPAVRAEALVARVRIGQEKALASLAAALEDENPVIRIAAVNGASHLKEKGLPVILKARKDSSEDVRAAALVVLGDIEGDDAWKSIREGLLSDKLAERGSAAEALGKRKETGTIEAAITCFRNSGGREWVEIRESIVDQLAGRPPEATNAFLLEIAKGDPAPSVRHKAITALKKRDVKDVPEMQAAELTKSPYIARRFESNPVVVMETTKGTMEIECFAREAPVHVANFVGLVEKGFYDGLKWHRVVPSFVIQGGDPLGNGWGDAGWSLRAEINPIPYMRGTLGMPRSAGFDTGGSQIFITHLPTPHLDGYYTVFGQVVKGLDVLDAIEIGDRILSAKVK